MFCLTSYHIQYILKIQLIEMLLAIELMIKKHSKNTFWLQVFSNVLYKIVWIVGDDGKLSDAAVCRQYLVV